MPVTELQAGSCQTACPPVVEPPVDGSPAVIGSVPAVGSLPVGSPTVVSLPVGSSPVVGVFVEPPVGSVALALASVAAVDPVVASPGGSPPQPARAPTSANAPRVT